MYNQYAGQSKIGQNCSFLHGVLSFEIFITMLFITRNIELSFHEFGSFAGILKRIPLYYSTNNLKRILVVLLNYLKHNNINIRYITLVRHSGHYGK